MLMIIRRDHSSHFGCQKKWATSWVGGANRWLSLARVTRTDIKYTISMAHFENHGPYRMTKLPAENLLLFQRMFDILKSFKPGMRRPCVENVMPVGMPSMRLIFFTHSWLAILKPKLPAGLSGWDASVQICSIHHDGSLRENELEHLCGMRVKNLQSNKPSQAIGPEELGELWEEVAADLR